MRPVRGHQGRPVGICGIKAYWDIPGLSGPLKDWAMRDDAPKVLGGETRELAGLAAWRREGI